MPVSYPATMPTSGVTSLSWTNATSSTLSRSPFSFQGQAQSYGGAIRYAQISVTDLNREQAEDWIGFLDSLNGTLGTFLFGDPMATSPIGIGGGSPKLRVNEVAGTDLLRFNGAVPSLGQWLKRGDWIQIGTGLDTRLYKVVQPVVGTNSSGEGSVLVWPTLRSPKPSGTDLIINNPRGLFRRSNGTYGYTEDNGCKYSLSFDCEEVI